MCGIACIINTEKAVLNSTLEKFTNAVSHRGPDGSGFAKFAVSGEKISPLPDDSAKFAIGLGHRRLSILDLSSAGAQPMFSHDSSCVISYNGEIYNYLELAEELQKDGFSFKSHCDTEVVLAAYRKWGTDCFRRFNGMWAMVILDMKKNKLVISRDRLGIKPLYYCRTGTLLAFASEIKQFRALPEFTPRPNHDACIAYLINGYEIPPETFYADVYTFPPANFAEIPVTGNTTAELKPEKFWFPEKIIPEKLSAADAAEEIKKRFHDAVRLRLRSDVPVGTCLSGGLDSSAIFMQMGSLSDSDFKAFSACFDDPTVDETRFMEAVIRNSRSTHFKTFPIDADFAEDFNKLLAQHAEPVGSISIYAQYQVMKSARKNNVPVLLDGQGGDELFSGYWPTYFLYLDQCRRNGSVIPLFANFAASVLPGGNPLLISEAFTILREFRRKSGLRFPYDISREKSANFAEFSSAFSKARSMTPEEYRIHELTDLRLPRLLKWEDRNSMAFSIESRVPFLDINLIEFILSVPPEMNMKKGWTKYLFRKSMSEILPAEICWRKDKKGFETPQDKWMKQGPLHDLMIRWADDSTHPVSEYITTPFSSVKTTLHSGSFDTNSMFRLFCLDKWLGLLSS